MKTRYMLPVLLVVVLLLPAMPVRAETWSITVLNSFGEPVGPDGLEPASNFTVEIGIPITITTAGGRYLVIESSKTNVSAPLYRKSLGLFDSGYNGTRLINISLNLKIFEADLNPHGDYLHIWVERTGGSIEADAPNIIIRADFDRLLEQQQQLLFAYIQEIQRDFTNQIFFLTYRIQELQNYVLALALLVIFVGVFSARDFIRKNQKANKQAEVSRSAFDAWLKAYIGERLSAADIAQIKVDKIAVQETEQS